MNITKNLTCLFIDCERTAQRVIEASTAENLQPFKDKMTTFLEHSKKQLASEFENLEDCHKKFVATMKFYLFKPKTGTLEAFPPSSFFELWLSFCVDFKDILSKELIRLEREKYVYLMIQYFYFHKLLSTIPY